MNAGQSLIPIPTISVSVERIYLFCVAEINALRTNGKTNTSKWPELNISFKTRVKSVRIFISFLFFQTMD